MLRKGLGKSLMGSEDSLEEAMPVNPRVDLYLRSFSRKNNFGARLI